MLGVAIFLTALAVSQTSDRARAEQLARDGRPLEAIQIFRQIVAADPADAEARTWVARLDLRLGHAAEAAAEFRVVLAAHPADVDARVGLGAALTRLGDWQQALDVLRAAERDAGENADVFAALATAHRRAGDDRRALDYFRRARALSPNDPDLEDGYENAARAYGHGIAVEGFGQQVNPGSTAQSGTVTLRLRAATRVFALGYARVQTGVGYRDGLYGGGVDWRATRTTTLLVRAAGGSRNAALANFDGAVNVIHYAGAIELGGSVRELSFSGASVTALSPAIAWDGGGLWRLDGRYTWSDSRFAATGLSKGDNSGVGRATLRAWRRVWLNGTYAYGIESFEDLTRDRIGSLGAHTLAGGVKVLLASLTTIDATWEHQLRSNASRLDRVTVSLVQVFP